MFCMPERHWRLAFGTLGGGVAGHVHGGRLAQFIRAIVLGGWLDLLGIEQVRDRWYSQDLISLTPSYKTFLCHLVWAYQ
jgi:hypothetical protein